MSVDIDKLKKYLYFHHYIRYIFKRTSVIADIEKAVSSYDDKVHPLIAEIKRGNRNEFSDEKWDEIFLLAKERPGLYKTLAEKGNLPAHITHRLLEETKALIEEKDESYQTRDIKRTVIQHCLLSNMYPSDIQRVINLRPETLLPQIGSDGFDKKYIIPIYKAAIAKLQTSKRPITAEKEKYNFTYVLKNIDDFEYLKKIRYDGVSFGNLSSNQKYFFDSPEMYGGNWLTNILLNKHLDINNPEHAKFFEALISENVDFYALNQCPQKCVDMVFKKDVEKKLIAAATAPQRNVLSEYISPAAESLKKLRRLGTLSEEKELWAVETIIGYYVERLGKGQNYSLRSLIEGSQNPSVLSLVTKVPYHEDRKAIYWTGKCPIDIVHDEMEKTLKKIRSCIKNKKFRDIRDGWKEDLATYVKMATLRNIDDYQMLLRINDGDLTASILTSQYTPKEVIEATLNSEYTAYDDASKHIVFSGRPALLFAVKYNLTMENEFSLPASIAINNFFDGIGYNFYERDLERRTGGTPCLFGCIGVETKWEFAGLRNFLREVESPEDKKKFVDFLKKTADMPQTNKYHKEFADFIAKAIEKLEIEEKASTIDKQNVGIEKKSTAHLINEAECIAYAIRAQTDISAIADRSDEFIKIVEELDRRGLLEDAKKQYPIDYENYIVSLKEKEEKAQRGR